MGDSCAGKPLTNGHYDDIGSDTGSIKVTNNAGTARAWGKLDVAAGRGLLWIDNANDTWKRVADGQSVTPPPLRWRSATCPTARI